MSKLHRKQKVKTRRKDKKESGRHKKTLIGGMKDGERIGVYCLSRVMEASTATTSQLRKETVN